MFFDEYFSDERLVLQQIFFKYINFSDGRLVLHQIFFKYIKYFSSISNIFQTEDLYYINEEVAAAAAAATAATAPGKRALKEYLQIFGKRRQKTFMLKSFERKVCHAK